MENNQDSRAGQPSVLHVTEACGGGVARHLELVVPALMERGISCAFYAFGSRIDDAFKDMTSQLERKGCRVFIHESGKLTFPGEIYRIRKISRDFDAVHLHGFRAGFAGRLALGKKSPPLCVYSPHAFGISPVLSRFQRLACALAEKVLANRCGICALVGAAEQADALALGIPEDRIRLAENGLPMDFAENLLPRSIARRELGINEGCIALLLPCRLEAQKGVDTFIRAFAQCDFPNTEAFICGNGSLRRRLEKLTRELGMENRIHFTGVIPELHRYLNAFDAGVLPSYYEGLSYGLLEMLYAGLPVAASDISANIPAPELREFVSYFPPGNTERLAAVLRELVAPPEKAGNCKAVQAFMRNRFSLNTQADCLADIYRTAASNRNI